MIFRFRSFLKAESIADQPVVSARERPAEPTGNRIAKSETLDYGHGARKTPTQQREMT
jgi:hypothetical protein